LKAVVDTNVLVSGLLKPYSHPGAIVRLLAGGHIQLVYDARIIAEYREVLYRPLFGFKPTEIESLLDYVKDAGLAVATTPLSARLPDADDEPFLEAALAEAGAVIVTGNQKHFTSELCSGVQVFSPVDFTSYFQEQIMKTPDLP